MSRKPLINMAWMQALWFAAVLAAAAGRIEVAPAVLALFIGWQARPSIRVFGDFRLIPVALLLGFVLDSAWIRFGWIRFESPFPLVELAPLWILSLWVGLALTLNHSLAWLQSKLWLSGLLGGLGAPLSYTAAERLGALSITTDSPAWIAGLSIAWAAAIPLLLWLARELKRKASPMEAPHV
ncbi:MAG: DUF2878 domain-containing protein [Methylomicrobium sp.]